jgi:6-phosphofructokinase
MKTIGVLTGGGDCPGLNAVIRAVERAGVKYGFETLGIRNGWLGRKGARSWVPRVRIR